ncbi:MAG: hypothetical protein OEW21_19110, partial [Betaproteobacteria bacterium]|nr:hypothetical protein [Betaproteobacteria bacterium]
MIRSFRALPLSTKLIAVVLAASLLGFTFSMIFKSIEEVSRARRELTESMRVTADLVGANSAAAILFGDRKVIAQSLDSLRASPSMVAAWIQGREGEMLGVYGHPSVSAQAQVPPSRGLQQDTWRVPTRLLVRRPIAQDGATIGWISIEADTSEYWNDLVYG